MTTIKISHRVTTKLGGSKVVINFEEIKQRKLVDKIIEELEEVNNMTEEELDELYKDYYKNY